MRLFFTKENIDEFCDKPHLFNLALFFRLKREAYDKKVEIPIVNSSNFIDEFAEDLRSGIKWCQDTSEHWAEILIVKVTESIITFNLAVIAFDAAASSLFVNKNSLAVSILFSIISLIILIQFLVSVSKRNINSIGDRRYIMGVALKKLHSDVPTAVTTYNTDMTKAQDKLRKHAEIWMPVQSIGIYFFIGSILSVLMGIFLK